MVFKIVNVVIEDVRGQRETEIGITTERMSAMNKDELFETFNVGSFLTG